MTAVMCAEQEAMQAARALTTALTGLGDALVRCDLPGVLDAEPALTTALAAATAARSRLAPVSIDRGQAVALAIELEGARAALARCATLGGSLDDFVRGCGLATATYDAAGAGVLPRMRSGFDQRV